MEKETFEEKKLKLLSSARAKLKRALKLVKAVEGDRQKLQAHEQCKTWGDICQSHFGQLKRGMSQILLQDPVTGNETLIPLSPELGPAQNIANLYKKHRRYRDGMEKTSEILEGAFKKVKREEDALAAIENSATLEELEALNIQTSQQKPENAKTKKSPPKKKEKFFKGYRRFFSENGYEMIVGRNDKQNDDLVRHSNGRDIWFHVRDFPGSHVIIRAMKNKEVPFDTIVHAAKLALKFSKKAQDMKGTIVYTFVKNLKRPKGAAPGKVLVTHEKTLQVGIEGFMKEYDNGK
jgi:predicted ribosome quality control (RQC) complex YloA/Tae2 family protein